MFITIARLGKDAELATTQSGKPLMKMTAAFDIGWGDNKQTVWLNAVKWGDKNEALIPYLKKGMRVQLQCSEIFPEAYIDKNTGTAKASLKATVSNIVLIDKPEGSRPSGAAPAASGNRQSSTSIEPNSGEVFDDDIPF